MMHQEHGLTARMKGLFFSGLNVASALVTLMGNPWLGGESLISSIDLGVLMMITIAAFGWGGAALGAIDVQLRRTGRVIQLPDSSAGG
ncbi:hypothetical protein B2J77_09010 [Pseudomonas parafulva]|uniref:Uncharacterized protein n=1 Tax=Pseudomonas parafulva TaxID=157782 RepID=A0ABM6J1W2_9PSED|nr:hypothetical protein B2J77_09010 [Pseudomonas parafulva]